MGDAGVRAMSRPPRFAVAAAPAAGALARISGPEAHHMRDVTRLEVGAAVTLIDASGAEHAGVIERYDRAGAEVRIVATEPARLRPTLIIAPAIVKGPRMDFIVEKAAELGATELRPVVCARGLVREPGAGRVTRWRRLALAAGKQSLLAPPMSVAGPVPFGDLIRTVPRDTLAVICSEGAEPMSRLLDRARPRAVLIACGPEGDFTPDEAAAAAVAGFVAAGLSRSRLRSETAAIAAVAIAAEWFAAASQPA
jgi:16S rRNA (uracil1498-N3)-methyltransferase